MGANHGQKSLPAIDVGSVMPNRSKSERYKSLVSTALSSGLKKVDAIDVPKGNSISLFVPPLLGAKVEVVAATSGLTFQETWASLVSIGHEIVLEREQGMKKAASQQEVPVPAFSTDQAKLYRNAIAGLEKNMVVLGEASTGVGKSWVINSAALKLAEQQEKCPIIIAAPTLAILGHLYSEMETVSDMMLTHGSIASIPSIAFFPGATEFVDDAKLAGYLASIDDEKRDVAVQAWVDGGGQPVGGNGKSVLCRTMRAMGLQPAWLMEDLRSIATEIDPEEFALTGDRADRLSSEILEKVRDQSREAKIIFATHAMLAYSARSKWTLLPPPKTLIVDEAHALENNFANVFSDSVSLRHLRARVAKHVSINGSGKTISKRVAKAVTETITAMSAMSNESQRDTIPLLEAEQSLATRILGALEDLKAAMGSKALNDMQGITTAREVVKGTIDVLSGKSADRAYGRFSPDRRYPSLLVGKADVRAILGGMWKTAKGGAFLTSATLYVIDHFGNWTSDYFCASHAVPASRVYSAPPVIAEWVTGKPVLHIPSKAKRVGLCRPSIKRFADTDNEFFRKLEARWLESLSSEVASVCKTAEGGTLVLCTAYPQINAMKDLLVDEGIDEGRIVTQLKNRKFSLFEEEFRSRHADGIRPVLLGLGTAWTGVNLKGAAGKESEDTLLTDLIIGVLPIGLNRSTTMLSKIDRQGTYPIEKEALMMTKQGLGRVQRHQDQQGRRIWIMDGRIWEPWKSMGNFQLSVQLMLNSYKHKKQF